MKKIVGVFGGSFDPPHVGHYQLVQAALQALPLDEVWVIPAGDPVHRTLSGFADGGQRADWLRQMFAGEEKLSVLDWEVSQNQPTPAIETLRWIKDEYPDVMPVWLMGSDAFASFSSWVEYPAHRDLCSVAVFRRAGYQDQHVPKFWAVGDIRQLGSIGFVTAEIADVSASEVRERMAQQGSLEGLVCECVREEIEEMYRSKSG